MDTTTVLEIIKMLDTRIDHYEQIGYLDDDQFGAKWGLINFRDHLQSFIEGQLNAAENQTEQ